MQRTIIICAALLLCIASARATTFHVGPTQIYPSPSSVMGLVQNGDTVEIDAGIYSGDVGFWTKDNLVIRGIGGYAHLEANGKSAGQKAIWVVQGAHTYIENIEFSGAAVADKNGAGIRLEGPGLELRHCYFHDNEDGVLAGDNPGKDTSDVLFEACEFARNGAGDGYSHNMYINHLRSFTLRFCYIHGAKVGHEVKSRALSTFILYNRITDESDGTASYCVDLPNGGDAYIMGNSIQKGPNAQNRQIIRFGEEGQTNPNQRIYIINNAMVSERVNSTFISLAAATTEAKIYNNIFAGPGTLYDMTIVGAVDSSTNLIANAESDYPRFWHFEDSVHYDYHTDGEDFSMAGTDPGSANGIDLWPTKQYRHPTDSVDRHTYIEVGPFHWHVLGVKPSMTPLGLRISPNPVHTTANILISETSDIHPLFIRLLDVLGREVSQVNVRLGATTIPLDASLLQPGAYRVVLSDSRRVVVATDKLIIR